MNKDQKLVCVFFLGNWSLFEFWQHSECSYLHTTISTLWHIYFSVVPCLIPNKNILLNFSSSVYPDVNRDTLPWWSYFIFFRSFFDILQHANIFTLSYFSATKCRSLSKCNWIEQPGFAYMYTIQPTWETPNQPPPVLPHLKTSNSKKKGKRNQQKCQSQLQTLKINRIKESPEFVLDQPLDRFLYPCP